MISKLKDPTLSAALRMGGYIGWSLAVMYICQQNLRYYRDDSLLQSVNLTFLTAGTITGAVLVVVLLLFDFDGLLDDKLLRWLPGVVMAETGIALSLANADTMTVFSAITGVASALGAMAAISHLLRVKVGRRMQTIGLALAIGGAIRLLTVLAVQSASRTALVVTAVGVGIFAALTVHTRSYSDEHGGLLVGLAEASPRTIISRVPYVYIVLPVLAGAFWFAHTHIGRMAADKLSAGYDGYEYFSYIGYIAAALICAAGVKMSRLSRLYIFGTGLSAASAMLAGLPYLTAGEASVFAFMSFASLACIRACIYMFIIVFSLDRPHPMFYAMFGFTVTTLAEQLGVWLDGRMTGLPLLPYIVILLILIPLGGGLLAFGMNRYGFSQEKLDHRHIVRDLIRRRSAELELSEREQGMLEAVVLDGFGVEELSGRYLFSHNTIKVLLRPVFAGLGVGGLQEARDEFERLAQKEEAFLAEVHDAEDKKRAEDKKEQHRIRRETRENNRAERKRLEREQLERKQADFEVMEVVLGGADPEELAAARIAADEEAAEKATETVKNESSADVKADGASAAESNDNSAAADNEADEKDDGENAAQDKPAEKDGEDVSAEDKANDGDGGETTVEGKDIDKDGEGDAKAVDAENGAERVDGEASTEDNADKANGDISAEDNEHETDGADGEDNGSAASEAADGEHGKQSVQVKKRSRARKKRG